MLGLKLSLHVDALLEEYALEQRVLISQHQTLVRGGTMSSIQVSQGLLLDTDGLLELLDVLGSALPKSCLSLAVSLLPLLCGRIDLGPRQYSVSNPAPHTAGSVKIPRDWPCEDHSKRTRKARECSQRTGLRPPFRLGAWPSGVGRAWPCSPESAGSPSPSPSGLEPNGDSSLSCLIGSFLLSSEGLSVAIPLTGSGDDCREGAANASSPHEGDKVHRRARLGPVSEPTIAVCNYNC